MIKALLNITIFLFALNSEIHATGSIDSLGSNEKYYELIKEFVLGYNDVYQTPYFALIGKNPNPVMLLHGGMHGDEIAGYLACDSILKNINITEGTLIIIPRLNIQACQQDRRYINIDLNHAFPGDLTSDVYEFRLAHEFMYLVDSIQPNLIINLHEALTRYDSQAADDSEKAFGQVLITCVKPYESILENAFNTMNDRIPRDDYKFHVHFYAFHDYSSLDNFVAKFNIKSYTVETFRGFNIDDRVKLQEIAVLSFMQEAGLKFEFPDIKFN